MSDTSTAVVVNCSADDLPVVGEFVHVVSDGQGCNLIGSYCRLPVVPKIDDEQEDVDQSSIQGIVLQIDAMHRIPGTFSIEPIDQDAPFMVTKFAIWIG